MRCGAVVAQQRGEALAGAGVARVRQQAPANGALAGGKVGPGQQLGEHGGRGAGCRRRAGRRRNASPQQPRGGLAHGCGRVVLGQRGEGFGGQGGGVRRGQQRQAHPLVGVGQQGGGLGGQHLGRVLAQPGHGGEHLGGLWALQPGQYYVARGVGQGQLGGFEKAAAQAVLQLGQVAQIGAPQQQQGQHQQAAHPHERHPALKPPRVAQPEEQQAGEAHAERLEKPLGLGVGRQALRGRQGLKQDQKHRVEHGTPQYLEQQVQPAIEGQLPAGAVHAAQLQAPEQREGAQRHRRQQPQRPLHAVAFQGLPAHEQLEERGRQVGAAQHRAHRAGHVGRIVKLVLHIQKKQVFDPREHGCDAHQAQAHGQHQLAAAEQLPHQRPRGRPGGSRGPGRSLHHVRAQGGAQGK